MLRAQTTSGTDRWEKDIVAFEEQDRVAPPPKDAIVFLGSSTIRGWDLAACFPGRTLINRGFGGSQTSDALHFVDRLATKHAPRAVVVYEGDNDIAQGKSPETVCQDFLALVERIHAVVPDCPVLFLGIKPSIKRWELWPTMQEANQLVATHAAGTPLVRYIDTAPATLGADGMPNPALFKEDGLHLNDAGNQAWARLVEPYLAQIDLERIE
jgi:lysophospholipase L1-like esterase